MLDKLKNFKISNLKGSKSSSEDNKPGQGSKKNQIKELFSS